MRYKLLLFGLLYVLLVACQRQRAFFQPTVHVDYKTPAFPAEAPIVAMVDSVYRQTEPEAVPSVASISEASPAPVSEQHVRRTRLRPRAVYSKIPVSDVVNDTSLKPREESPANRAGTTSLIAALVGIAGWVATALIPGAAVLLLLVPIGGIWAIASAIRAYRRSQKGDPGRGKATIGLVLGILLSLVSLVFFLYILAFAGAFSR